MPRLSHLSRSITGQVALVTGAASGMGRAEALLLADEGARVACVDLSPAVEETAARINAEYGSPGRPAAGSWVLDVADAGATRATVAEVTAALGPVDILINNAGVALPAVLDGEVEEFDRAWERTLAVNLSAHQQLVRACLPSVTRIVNIASTEALGASRYNSPYVAAKHGVIGLTRALAVELGGRGVTVNAVCPGPIHTGMTAPIADEAKRKFARRKVPAGRYGDPEEVAHAVLGLVLPAMAYVNGAVVVVDGGMTAKND